MAFLRFLLLFSLSNLLFWVNRIESGLLRGLLIAALVIWYLFFQIRPRKGRLENKRLRIMMGGYELFRTALYCLAAECVLYAALLIAYLGKPSDMPIWAALLLNLLVFLPVLFLTALNGFLRIIFTSSQLGVVWRVLLVCLWWCPFVNLFLFSKACRVVRSEYRFETAKLELNDLRRENEICKTHYPIVLVHGIFFRDWQLVNYWGRIPKELIRNGADIHYGGQQSSAAIAQSGAELKEQIMRILEETGAEKVNLIAHSKGGLDSRYAISRLGLAPFVASLTTINTPHRGCVFAQQLMDTLPKGIIHWLGARYNAIFHTLGDPEPDFLAGVSDLRADRCAAFNAETPDAEGVFYQSVMSTMRHASSASFPLNLAYLLVKKYDKETNDGLVSLSSALWGSYLGTLSAPGKRGISHGDVIDLMRENVPGFDVREFYVGLVKDLKAHGL